MRTATLVMGGMGAVVLSTIANVVLAAHPLDPLTAEEIGSAVAILRGAGKVDEASRFPEVGLREPAKADVLAWREGQAVPRRAWVVVLDRAANRSHEAVVDLVARRVESWEEVRGGQPMILFEEYELAGKAVRADARWKEAMARRGITNGDDVYLDVWAPGELEARGAAGARLARVLSFHRGTQKNPYGPPVEGVVAVVDLNTWRVLEVVDTGVLPMSKESTDFYDPAVTGARPALRPLLVSTPEGAGFSARGHAVEWDKWRLRWSMTPREGLVLHQVGWEEGGAVRSILYRASLSEMLVPYGDPASNWSWRSAFDEGEYGLGRLSNVLEAGTTAPTHAALFDSDFADDRGEPYVLPRSVAVYERDAGVLWNHYDFDNHAAARRARELVLEFITTIGNYDYRCAWVFRQDGIIELEVNLSGSLLMKGVASTRCEVCASDARAGQSVEPKGEQRHGTLVAENVLAPNHQHFVNVRLDLDVDGPVNGVKEMNVRADAPGSRNPRGNAFFAVATPLRRERAATRDTDNAHHRTWEVFSTSSRNAQGHPTACALSPGANAAPFLTAGAPMRRLGVFAQHAVHATRYRDGEMSAAGPYVSQNRVPGGLARWTADDESLDGEDVVVWYTMGVTHVARPEEYPIMGSTEVGFKLVPVGFFSRNPGLDVPR